MVSNINLRDKFNYLISTSRSTYLYFGIGRSTTSSIIVHTLNDIEVLLL
jgi:hypothetical protein